MQSEPLGRPFVIVSAQFGQMLNGLDEIFDQPKLPSKL